MASGCWDAFLVQNHFFVTKTLDILSRPISGHGVEDRLAWFISKFGAFSFRSAYWVRSMAKKQQGSFTNCFSGSSSKLGISWRQVLWRLCVPNKINSCYGGSLMIFYLAM